MNIPYSILKNRSIISKNTYDYHQALAKILQQKSKPIDNSLKQKMNYLYTKEKIFDWLFSLDLKTRLKICSLNNNWLSKILFQMITYVSYDSVVEFRPKDSFPEFSRQKIYPFNSKISHNEIGYLIKDENFFIDEIKGDLKGDFWEFFEGVNNVKKLTGCPKSYQIRSIDIRNHIANEFMKEIKFISLNDLNDTMTFDLDLLCNRYKMQEYFNFFSKEKIFNSIIQIIQDKNKNYNFSFPTWINEFDSYNLYQLIIIFFEQIISIYYQIYLLSNEIPSFDIDNKINDFFQMNLDIENYLSRESVKNFCDKNNLYNTNILFFIDMEKLVKDLNKTEVKNKIRYYEIIAENIYSLAFGPTKCEISNDEKFKKEKFNNIIRELEKIYQIKNSKFINKISFIETKNIFQYSNFIYEAIYKQLCDQILNNRCQELLIESEKSDNKKLKKKKHKSKKNKKTLKKENEEKNLVNNNLNNEKIEINDSIVCVEELEEIEEIPTSDININERTNKNEYIESVLNFNNLNNNVNIGNSIGNNTNDINTSTVSSSHTNNQCSNDILMTCFSGYRQGPIKFNNYFSGKIINSGETIIEMKNVNENKNEEEENNNFKLEDISDNDLDINETIEENEEKEIDDLNSIIDNNKNNNDKDGKNKGKKKKKHKKKKNRKKANKNNNETNNKEKEENENISSNKENKDNNINENNNENNNENINENIKENKNDIKDENCNKNDSKDCIDQKNVNNEKIKENEQNDNNNNNKLNIEDKKIEKNESNVLESKKKKNKEFFLFPVNNTNKKKGNKKKIKENEKNENNNNIIGEKIISNMEVIEKKNEINDPLFSKNDKVNDNIVVEKSKELPENKKSLIEVNEKPQKNIILVKTNESKIEFNPVKPKKINKFESPIIFNDYLNNTTNNHFNKNFSFPKPLNYPSFNYYDTPITNIPCQKNKTSLPLFFSFIKNVKVQKILFFNFDKEISDYVKKIDDNLTILNKYRDLTIEKIKNLISSIIKSKYDFKFLFYGSHVTKLSVEFSDIDVLIKFKIKDSTITKNTQKNVDAILFLLENELNKNSEKFDIAQINAIYTASVPVLKIKINLEKIIPKNLQQKLKEQYDFDYENELLNLNFDFTFLEVENNMEEKKIPAQEIIPYIKKNMIEYKYIRPMILVLKRYMQLNKLNSSFHGGISSYSLFLLILAYIKENNNDESLGKKLYGFFEYYGNFIFSMYSINANSDNPFILMDINNKSNVLVIIDPITSLNVAKSSFRMEEIKSAFARGAIVINKIYYDLMAKINETDNNNKNDDMKLNILNELFNNNGLSIVNNNFALSSHLLSRWK